MDLNAPDLGNKWVKLEPLTPSDEMRAFLRATGIVEAMWEWLPRVPGGGVTFDAYYEHVTSNIKRGAMIPFLVHDAKTGKFIGGANFINPSRTHRNVQIGFVWTAPDVRRSYVTLAAQAAMVARAVEWRAKRVYWLADMLNAPYMAFLEQKIQAEKEGELKCVARMNDGRWCDVAVYALTGEALKQAPARLTATLDAMD